MKARGMVYSPDRSERMQDQGREIVKLYKIKGMFNVSKPYTFIQDSLLIQGVNVPGDACDLSLDDFWKDDFLGDRWKEMAEIGESRKLHPVDYVPHNIDLKDQAFCALSL